MLTCKHVANEICRSSTNKLSVGTSAASNMSRQAIWGQANKRTLRRKPRTQNQFFDTGLKAMAGGTWKDEVVKVQQDTSLPITSRCTRILEILKQNGLCFQQCIEPKMILVHVKNRGGQLVSVSDVHQKGAVMAQIGFSMGKIGQSVCFALPSSGTMRHQVVEANKSLAQLSQNQLCEPLGCERFASVSSSSSTRSRSSRWNCRAMVHSWCFSCGFLADQVCLVSWIILFLFLFVSISSGS